MTAKTAFPLIAALVLAATTGLAAEHETVIQDPVTGEVLARGAAVVDPPVPGVATSAASANVLLGSRSASGTATIPGIPPGRAAAESSVSAELGARSGFGAAEILNATGTAFGSSELGPSGLPPLTGHALGEAVIDPATGDSATAVSGVTIGEFSTGGAAGTNLGGSYTSSDSEVEVTDETDFLATTTALSEPLTGGGADGLEIEPRFSPEPLLPDRTFSFSKVERGGPDFIAASETWKGAESGAAFSVSHAETDTSFTMGVSSGDVEVGPTSSFSQAISLPSAGESALFTSGTAESTDGLSTFSASVVVREALTGGSEEFAFSVAIFDGNGLAHADALAGLSYGEIDVKDAFDAVTLDGVAFSVAEVLSPAADVDSIIEVEGDGSTLSRTTFVSVGLESAQVLAQAPSAVAANTVVLNQTLENHTVLEVGATRMTEIVDSGLNSRGIININQDAGNSNNQANIRSIALTDSADALLMNQVTGSVATTGNTLQIAGGDRSNVIDGSFKGGTGVVGINQSTGSLNQLNNVLALALGVGGGATVAMGDVSLSAVHSDNTIEQSDTAPTSREDRITGGSFDGFVGIAQVNQSAGDLNQINSTIMASATMQ